MPRYAALLRAINVGGHTVTMARLREVFADLGLAGVETLLASGNVLFDAPDRGRATLERRIEGHLARALGYPVATFLRTAEELSSVVAAAPFSSKAIARAGTRLFVVFVRSKVSPAVAGRIRRLATRSDELVVGDREIYWLCHVAMNDATVSGAVLEKALGMPVTVRNVTTVRKLAGRLSESGRRPDSRPD